MLGYAATVKVRGSAPPTAERDYPDRTDWWDYILSLPAPRVVVVQDEATKAGLGSLLGAVHVNILRALGCVGAVTNGAVRDLPAAEKLGFSRFSQGGVSGFARLHPHRRFRNAGANRRIKDPIGRFVARGFAWRPIDPDRYG